jgi:hypothetical protein
VKLWNPTPLRITARAKGVPYVFEPDEIIEVGNVGHGRHLLQIREEVGLSELVFGSKKADIKLRAREALAQFIGDQIQNFNDLQQGQARQGLPGVIPPQGLRELQKIYKDLRGREFSLTDEEDVKGNVVGELVKGLVAAKEVLGEGPKARALTKMLTDVVELASKGEVKPDELGKILETSELPVGPGARKGKIAAREALAKRKKSIAALNRERTAQEE